MALGLGAVVALLGAAGGAPPGLDLAVGSWPTVQAVDGRGTEARRRDEAEIGRALAADEQGCFQYAPEDLDGDGRPDWIVQVRAPCSCGTGGCPLDLLRVRDGRVSRLARLILVRNVFVAPWSGKGLRPLVVEKWGESYRMLRARKGRYSATADCRTARLLPGLPRRAREVAWRAAAACGEEGGCQ